MRAYGTRVNTEYPYDESTRSVGAPAVFLPNVSRVSLTSHVSLPT